ncbi:MAG: OmpH family outer membrane protein [Gemmobacter sp.]|nr:OmpH family outer membrane protein [Gemmobacter sp.]
MARREQGLAVAMAALLGGLVPAVPAQAQTGTAAPPAPPREVRSQIATIQPDQLFARTAFGMAMQARTSAASAALQDENRRIEAALEAEERALTDRRKTLPPEEFRTLAEAFDTKVEGIRAAQDAKGRALKRQAEEDRQRFFETALPVLADLMGEIGAVALLDKSGIVLSLDAIDITERAVTRIDAVLGDGSSLETGAAVTRSAPDAAEPVPAP